MRINTVHFENTSTIRQLTAENGRVVFGQKWKRLEERSMTYGKDERILE